VCGKRIIRPESKCLERAKQGREGGQQSHEIDETHKLTKLEHINGATIDI